MRWMIGAVVTAGCASVEGSDTGTCAETVERHVSIPNTPLHVYCDVVMCCDDASVVRCVLSEDDLATEGAACEADCAEVMAEALGDCD